LVAADWAVDRGGLIYLDDPISKEKGLKEGDEPIQIYMYVIDHPIHGRYFIDTGMANVFKKDSSEWPLNWLLKKGMNLKQLKVKETLGDWMNKNPEKINGVFLTHMHIDHVMGGTDLTKEIPIFTGPRESTHKAFINLFVQGSTNDLLGEEKTIQELEFSNSDPDLGLSVLDFFGDGSFLVIHCPGHTPGSLAFLVHSTTGLHLVLGDTSHTTFGWENNVPPGDFSADREENRKSLTSLRMIAKKFKEIKAHPGHQSFKE